MAETTAPYQPQPDDGLIICYYQSFSDVGTMMAEPDILLVRGTPVQVAGESDVGVCWILEVTESSQIIPDQIELIQAKDKHLLKTMEEVVLVLKAETAENRYSIVGGNCGIFCLNEDGSLSGPLAESLLSDRSAADAIQSCSGSVLDTVYDILESKF